MKENSQEYWNSVANNWERFGDLNKHVEKYVDSKLVKYLSVSDNSHILNLGSGSGDRYLSRYKDLVIHVDYAANVLKANQLGIKVEADARSDLPFSNEIFENITSFFLMRYLTREQQLSLTNNAIKLLKVGGVLLVVDVPDNKHQFQVDTFDPEVLVSGISLGGIDVIEAQTEIQEVGKYINTGFGGWYEHGTYKMSTLVIKKHQN